MDVHEHAFLCSNSLVQTSYYMLSTIDVQLRTVDLPVAQLNRHADHNGRKELRSCSVQIPRSILRGPPRAPKHHYRGQPTQNTVHTVPNRRIGTISATISSVPGDKISGQPPITLRFLQSQQRIRGMTLTSGDFAGADAIDAHPHRSEVCRHFSCLQYHHVKPNGSCVQC